ncbi:MAG: rhodanese-like domain-containing protein [Gammaproteobacteria bacterium]
MQEISPTDLESLLSGALQPVILDIREPWELALASLPMTLNIPMGQLPDRLSELDGERDIVVMCHHGNRSRQVVKFLEQSGFPRVINLCGGIDAWSDLVDPAIPQY